MSRIPYPERAALTDAQRAYLDAPDRRMLNIGKMAMHTGVDLRSQPRQLAFPGGDTPGGGIRDPGLGALLGNGVDDPGAVDRLQTVQFCAKFLGAALGDRNSGHDL